MLTVIGSEGIRVGAVKLDSPRRARGLSLATAVGQVQRYIDGCAPHWAGSQAEYNDWARGVMAGALVNFSHALFIEEGER